MLSPGRGLEAGRVLVVEDDPSIRALIVRLLGEEGIEALEAEEGNEALRKAQDSVPDVVLLDLMLPGMDGIEICRRLRADPLLRNTGIIMLTAKSSLKDRVEGLQAGADDYVVKPFEPAELLERVRGALRRSSGMASLSPLTGLPGNREIQERIIDLISNEEAFALMHVDIDAFKQFNDYYGVLRGDLAIKLLARCISSTVRERGGYDPFVGHIGGDDFVLIVEPEAAEELAAGLIRSWDASVRGLYDPTDLERGYLEMPDRRGEPQRYPPMTISIGVATTTKRRMRDHLEAADIAAEMKQVAKRESRSSSAIDQRAASDLETRPRIDESRARRLHPAGKKAMQWIPRQPGEAAGNHRERDRHRQMSVLIVDDDPEIRAALEMHCELQGFAVVAETGDGREACSLAATFQPDVVLLDYLLPGMSGQDVAAELRRLAPEAKIVAFSGVLEERPDWADAFLAKTDISDVTRVLLQLRRANPSEDLPSRPDPA